MGEEDHCFTKRAVPYEAGRVRRKALVLIPASLWDNTPFQLACAPADGARKSDYRGQHAAKYGSPLPSQTRALRTLCGGCHLVGTWVIYGADRGGAFYDAGAHHMYEFRADDC